MLTKEIVWVSMSLLKYLSIKYVDKIAVSLGRLVFGDLSKYGIKQPKEGPFTIKAATGQSPTIDVGCIPKIKQNKIKVIN